jgi:hypothetical protein
MYFVETKAAELVGKLMGLKTTRKLQKHKYEVLLHEHHHQYHTHFSISELNIK